ncbi:HD family phosphohydrolase [Paenibacillus selenitireducens]|uniref:HD family phosphohydrolase n=1 Tax=Paenibacillus selenitireducens TaxID=1324314 RepID=A0A1T2XGN3_9BACL|nr:HD-GYP domain-containing protein [Paenibacillus selenitireducens]OPA78995.1 HD family phosphohydrolase [Paenibacillus selenitireducens]
MASVSISQLKMGDKITQDVHTPLGSLLFYKGKVLLQRDLEILQAFLVTQVSVDRPEDYRKMKEIEEAQEATAGDAASPVSASFYEKYDKMVALVKKAFKDALVNEIPMMGLRSQLELLIADISDYNILTFIPRQMKEREYMYHNAVLVALTSYCLAKWQGIQQKELMQVALAGLLHDIGNAKVDPDILFKPSSLTREETEEVRRHTTYGYNLLKNVASLNEGVKRAALQHHEKIDASGYPLGVKANQIHQYAKIVAVADIFHAMTLDRTFKKGQSPYPVLEQLEEESFGKLDAEYVQTFIRKVTQFHHGMIVRLNDGRMGEIVFSDRNHPTRPWVSVNGVIINLVNERSLFIQEILLK